MSDDDLKPAMDALRVFLDLLEAVPEAQRPDVFKEGQLDRLFTLFAPRIEPGAFPYEYLLSHKSGLTLIAMIRHAITMTYSVKGTVDNHEVFVSPSLHQLYDEGVMFLQGEERFLGLIGRYFDGRVTFAVAARDAVEGEQLGPDDFLFLDVDTVRQQQQAVLATRRIDAVARLEELLARQENRESEYQEFFTRYPWVLGAQHTSVLSHIKLDDANIPDFTAARARDGARDILEIKPPFLPLFRADGEFSAEFNAAWNQSERYLDFTRREADYLRRQKGLRFENPHCYLIAGRNLSPEERARVQAKERMNPAITFLTYEEIGTLAKNTKNLLAIVRSETESGPA